jgi:predicted RNase H-like nuclease (RuvC/YqgF family)
MPDQITTTRLARMQGVTAETIRNRAKAIEEFLSEGASSYDGSKMVFDARDVSIMRRVDELSNGGRTYDEIKTIIADEVGQGLFEGIYDVSLTPNTGEGRSIVEYEQQIGRYQLALGEERKEKEALKRRLASREEELKAKNEELNQARHKIGVLEGELAAVRRQSEKEGSREEKINELSREIGKLEAKIEMLNEELSKKK